MKLAKQHLDVGLFTNNPEPMLEFWRDVVGLPYEEALPTGGGTMQHRHGLNGGVLKLNHSREPLPDNPQTGYRRLLIAREGLSQTRELVDPDGNLVSLVSPASLGEATLGIAIAVRNLAASGPYYAQALDFHELEPGRLACGKSLLLLEEDVSLTPDASMRGAGYRYLTVQVWDCDAELQGIAERGGAIGAPPRTLGNVARFGFARDPDGNWMEISQRASLTGPLPTT